MTRQEAFEKARKLSRTGKFSVEEKQGCHVYNGESREFSVVYIVVDGIHGPVHAHSYEEAFADLEKSLDQERAKRIEFLRKELEAAEQAGEMV